LYPDAGHGSHFQYPGLFVRCTLQAGPDTLTVRAEATNEENLQRLQNLITRDLERFGRRDHLKVNWQRPEAPAVQAGEAG
jgi:hypothetical protein